MKTEKQIQILTEELAQRCIEQSKDMDKIEISGEKFLEIYHLALDLKDVKMYPILNEGCIIIHFNEITEYVLFFVQDDSTLIKATVTDENGTHYAEFFVIQNTENPFQVEIGAYKDATTMIYEKQRRGQNEIRNYVQEHADDNGEAIDVYVSVMVYINYLLENPEIKEIERKQTTPRKKAQAFLSQEQQTPQKPSGPREIRLNGIKVVTTNQKVGSALVSKKRRRLTDSWNVMGHYRHYKDGKVVYVKPYVKGKGKIEDKRNRVIKIE